MKHTKTPWEVEAHHHVDDEVWSTIVRGAIDVTHNTQPHEIACDKYSALPQEENEANAAFIVKAVNNHYQLLEALKSARNDIASYPHSLGYDITSLPQIDEAIKQAEAE